MIASTYFEGMTTAELEYNYEASDEASEGELLDRSLSCWKGFTSVTLGIEEEFTPIPLCLCTAASIGSFDVVRSLIQKGNVDINAKNRGGWNPLMYASYIGHDTIVHLLLDAGVSVNVSNTKGQTPLMLAASCGNESVAYFLLQAGADIEAVDRKGWTAMFHATYSGHQNIVRFLLDNNCNMETKEPQQNLTPFMQAAMEGHEIIVQDFLQHGVNMEAKAFTGDTARSLALMNGHTKIVSLIDNYALPTSLRAEAGLHFGADLSSSDEAVRPNRHRGSRGGRYKSKGPSIQDGPEAFEKLMDWSKKHDLHIPSAVYATGPAVPQGYVSYQSGPGVYPRTPIGADWLTSRDVTSPINPEDHKLDSSGGKESYNDEEEDNAFSQTGALTIKSSSSSSGGLAAALGLTDSENPEPDGTPCSKHKSGPPCSLQETPCSVAQNTKHIPDAIQPKPSAKATKQLTDTKPTTNHINDNSNKHKSRHKSSKSHEEKSKTNKNSSELKPKNGTTKDDSNKNNGKQSSKTTKYRECILKEQESLLRDRPRDLAGLLEELGLSKYLVTFEEQDVDLQVFLTLTDTDLKEVGIKLFGPRKKMNNAIARWHSNARPCRNDLEQAYADKLESEMQEMAIQLTKTCEDIEGIKKQLLQESELRAVAETCLMDDRAAWQQVNRLAAATRELCCDMQDTLVNIRQLHTELSSLTESQDNKKQVTSDTKHSAIDGATTDDKKTVAHIRHKMTECFDEMYRAITIATINSDKLLGKQIDIETYATDTPAYSRS
ncbi:unnamed protein product [Owenia fusiformis]|uniref:Uncharacterized protein n=1 Tax=Owenia fusiformis TaxID=6347 RepID=A0A8J1TZG8_OWEFU|nr:unnamed protein product [Owenia fusiformis]